MLDTEFLTCLNEAFESARLARHECMTTEHLLLAIVNTPRVAEILRACRADVPRLHRDLSAFIDATMPRLPDGDDRDMPPMLAFQRVLLAEILRTCHADVPRLHRDLSAFIDATMPRLPDGDDRDVQSMLAFQRVLLRAVFYVQGAGKNAASVDIVLTAIFSEKRSHAVQLLSMQGVTRLDVVRYIEHGIVHGFRGLRRPDDATPGGR